MPTTTTATPGSLSASPASPLVNPHPSSSSSSSSSDPDPLADHRPSSSSLSRGDALSGSRSPSTSTSSSSSTSSTQKSKTKPPTPPAAAVAAAEPVLAPRPVPTVARRSTLTSRFPLLRKSSREPAHLTHTRGNSNSTNSTHLLPTAAPRASISSSRGRQDPSIDQPRPRNPSTVNSNRSLSREPERFAQNPPARSPSRAVPSPAAAPIPPPDHKMHQTSSRLLRMTDDERPFTRDFKDLFSTLMVSLPLTSHRVRFRMIDSTFTSDEAITNLGSLKFSQSNRMPDPKDSSRVVTTTTTTTFSMAKEMARSVCQKFLEAKFVESCENKVDFQNKSSVWQLSPKGIHILDRFCSRNGIQSAHVKNVIESPRNAHQLVILERNTETDKLHNDEQTVEIIFRRFVGHTANEVHSETESVHEFSRCDTGVRLVKHKPTSSRPYEYTLSGRTAAEWLMDCSTMVDRRESLEIGSMFLQLGLIAPVDSRNSADKFQALKQVHYFITQHGERVAGWNLRDDVSVNSESNPNKARDGAARDSNSNRTNVIIRNPSWRLLYREFLKDTMCEENLSFYLDVQEFNHQYRAAVNASGESKIETIRETLAAAYGLYNAFLAPGSPNELNIDHALRTQLATRMTRAVGDDQAMMQSLVEVASLFEKAQNSIFKLMSSDSVPKFIKHPKYGPQLRGLDAAAAAAYGTPNGNSR
ncbi:unnamed protein product [Periconia digitata]|uniref:RGS-domain-containing protein n=1 Tax=Periconia digitata TaxID=1303443 RepID=A0A9W4ULK9_9PLEO|nr:unnamed protein product [Periconia digitata]